MRANSVQAYFDHWRHFSQAGDRREADKWIRMRDRNIRKAVKLGICVDWYLYQISVFGERCINDAKRKHYIQKACAARRSVGWDITFKEWWSLWRDSEVWDRRGTKKGQYVMARYYDEGPYQIGNVEIIKSEHNLFDYHNPHLRRRQAPPPLT